MVAWDLLKSESTQVIDVTLCNEQVLSVHLLEDIFVFYYLSVVSACLILPSHTHTHTPLSLTLACLSGLLPCILCFPVWPLFQEVAQLVDKHHGGVGVFWGNGGGADECGGVGVGVGGHQSRLCGLPDWTVWLCCQPCFYASSLSVGKRRRKICDQRSEARIDERGMELQQAKTEEQQINK